MKKLLTIGFLISIIFVASAFVNKDKLFEITKNIEIFTNLYQELNAEYVDELDPGKLMKVGIDAMLNSLDPYTRFYSENQIERYKFLTEGKYDGIGARAQKIGDYLTIIEPYEGYAAHQAGLKAGDKIISVNGRSAVGKPEDEIRAMFRGAAGTDLPVTIQSFGSDEVRDVTLSRSEVSVSNVPYHGLVGEKTGYIVLTTFTANAGKNVADALRSLKQDYPDLKGVILDLRDNGGGLLHEAVNLCNVFIPKDKEVVFTKGKVRERDKSYKTRNVPIDLEVPLAVLINDHSASASEIVSGVIQDLDRGVIVGQRSFGKGLVQHTKSLGYNNNLKLTTAKYYIPSGRCIQSKEYQDGEPFNIPDSLRGVFYTANGRPVLDGGGVTPDLPVPHPPRPEVVKALESQFLIFEYVNQFVNERDTILPAKDFRFTDYEDFKAFLTAKDFKYTSSSERILSDLEANIDEEDADMLAHIEAVRTELEAEKKSEIDEHRDRITRLIETDIVSRYYYQKGKIQQSLDTDPTLDKAIALINDDNRYRAVLDGKK